VRPRQIVVPPVAAEGAAGVGLPLPLVDELAEIAGVCAMLGASLLFAIFLVARRTRSD
jgi:hypothetical protein